MRAAILLNKDDDDNESDMAVVVHLLEQVLDDNPRFFKAHALLCRALFQSQSPSKQARWDVLKSVVAHADKGEWRGWVYSWRSQTRIVFLLFRVQPLLEVPRWGA